ncbi:Hypothetical predicted protein, partial [Pelobates cultripes]
AYMGYMMSYPGGRALWGEKGNFFWAETPGGIPDKKHKMVQLSGTKRRKES